MKTIDDFAVLPSDLVVAARRDADAPHEVVAIGDIPADRMGLDIGPGSARLFAASLRGARTVFWNGPMGVFELAPYACGTRAVASTLASSEAFTVVGGGDTGAAIRASASPTERSATSPPAAAPAWNSSAARPCPAWPSWTRHESARLSLPPGRAAARLSSD